MHFIRRDWPMQLAWSALLAGLLAAACTAPIPRLATYGGEGRSSYSLEPVRPASAEDLKPTPPASQGELSIKANLGALPTNVPSGSRYVAMGSSFAAGPGVTKSADEPPTRCSRSTDNYAHQLARKRKLQLVDVSCGGATTAHILGRWNDLAPQVDAVTPDTRLVTVTIGGNDLGYIGSLYASSCSGAEPAQQPSFCRPRAGVDSEARSRALAAPTEEAWAALEARLEAIATEVRLRSPAAELVFVDYLTVLPETELCSQTPLSKEAAAQARATAKRLAELTAAVAQRTKARIVRASQMSIGHDACSTDPWVTGFIAPAGGERFAPYHPNLRGMAALADALDQVVGP